MADDINPEIIEVATEEVPFDFAAHAQQAVSDYLNHQSFYRDLATVVGRVLEECMNRAKIKVHSIQSRAKDPKSLGRKSAIPSDLNPNRPKYEKPLEEITDLAGVRVITHFQGTISDVDAIIKREFIVIEQSDKAKTLWEEERFGYQSVHYLVKIGDHRRELPEYERFDGHIAEIQVRTILQHAWAEIEHDIQYKSAANIPTEIRRRFMALAGMLEMADREFEAIQAADKSLADQTKKMVGVGKLGGIEITPNALKLFLDKRLGPDGRISDWSYDSTAKLLRSLGFRDLQQVEAAVSGYDDDQLSQLVWGARQGQTTRFETMLAAALGERYAERHPYKYQGWFLAQQQRHLDRLRSRGIPVGAYDPLQV